MDAPEDGVKLQLFRGLAADLYNPQVQHYVLLALHAGQAARTCSLMVSALFLFRRVGGWMGSGRRRGLLFFTESKPNHYPSRTAAYLCKILLHAQPWAVRLFRKTQFSVSQKKTQKNVCPAVVQFPLCAGVVGKRLLLVCGLQTEVFFFSFVAQQPVGVS